MIKLSVGLITFNESLQIERTLNAIKQIADEIIIVDSHSSDDTVEKAKKLGASVYIEEWKGFGAQKNSVIKKCNGEWILLIDADEVVTPELAKNIKKLLNDTPLDLLGSVYQADRSTICFNKELKYGGWRHDYIPRLFKKGAGYYSNHLVHEKFITEHPLQKLMGKLNHYSYLTMEDYLYKLNKYTTLGAQQYYQQKKRATIIHICFSPAFKFIRMYLWRLGFLDGIEGFVIASTSALYTMLKYFKLREIYKNNSYQIHEEQ